MINLLTEPIRGPMFNLMSRKLAAVAVASTKLLGTLSLMEVQSKTIKRSKSHFSRCYTILNGNGHNLGFMGGHGTQQGGGKKKGGQFDHKVCDTNFWP